jgi:hypothetical protein
MRCTKVTVETALANVLRVSSLDWDCPARNAPEVEEKERKKERGGDNLGLSVRVITFSRRASRAQTGTDWCISVTEVPFYILSHCPFFVPFLLPPSSSTSTRLSYTTESPLPTRHYGGAYRRTERGMGSWRTTRGRVATTPLSVQNFATSSSAALKVSSPASVASWSSSQQIVRGRLKAEVREKGL